MNVELGIGNWELGMNEEILRISLNLWLRIIGKTLIIGLNQNKSVRICTAIPHSPLSIPHSTKFLFISELNSYPYI